LVASIARHALPPRSVAGGLESIPAATCAMTPRRAPTSSTMATRIAATRVPLAAHRSGELRLCKLAPASGAKRFTRSPATGPSPMRKLSADANRQTVPISPVRKASESDARHSSSRRLMLESAAFNLAMSARANLDWSRPHFPLGEPGPFAFWRKD
jgi:hypothetical protein